MTLFSFAFDINQGQLLALDLLLQSFKLNLDFSGSNYLEKVKTIIYLKFVSCFYLFLKEIKFNQWQVVKVGN